MSVVFWNIIANKYSRQEIADQSAYERKLQLTWDYLKPDCSILEFGCGTGSTALLHAPKVASVLGLDYSKKMIEIARGKAQSQGVKNTDFQVGTLFDLSENEKFDVVLGLNVIHLIPEWRATIAKVHSLLKPGGVFGQSTICLGGGSSILKMILPIGGALGLIPKVQFIKAESILAHMKEVGFEILHDEVPGREKNCHFIVARKRDE